MNPASLVTIARRFSFVRETEGPNRGAWVSFLQRFCGGRLGDSWCAYLVSVVLDIAYHGHQPLHQTGSCEDMVAEARARGFVVSTPQIGDLYFFLDASGHAHHVGILTGVDPWTGIAGNTSESGLSSNGTGVFEHVLSVRADRVLFVRLP